jgi:copper transport protein
MWRRLALVAALTLATAAPAWGHAVPLHIEPPPGSSLATAPTAVFVTFDSPVHAGSRNAAVRNNGTNVLDGKPRVERGNRLVIPLQPGLTPGSYSVRWSIVSDDGHDEEGVLAFAVGSGTAPVSVLTTRGYVTWQRIVMRALFLLGVLGAVGVAFFSLAVLDGSLPRRLAHLLFGFFLLAFAGADALIHATSVPGTRFERFMIVAAVAAGVGAVAAALAPLRDWLRRPAWGAAAVLLFCPTFAGHALDPGQPAVIAPAADLIHLAGAAVWLGGVAALAVARVGTVRRFAQFALPAVVVVAIGGAARALTELSSVSQVWTTSYGRTLLFKSGLFALLLALAWIARRRTLPVQLALLVVLVVAVGTLTDLRPARSRTTVTAAQSNVPTPAPAPPAGAYVDAREAGPLAVGLALLDGKPTVTVVGPDGGAVTDEPVHVASSGRTFLVTVGRSRLRFVVPAKLQPAAAVLRRATRLYRASPRVTIRERLSSRPGNEVVSVYQERKPHHVVFRIVSSTTPGIAGERRVLTERDVPTSFWTDEATNVFRSGPDELTFYDPQYHAWYRLQLDGEGRPAVLTMVAGAHFMHHDYSFSAPAR